MTVASITQVIDECWWQEGDEDKYRVCRKFPANSDAL